MSEQNETAPAPKVIEPATTWKGAFNRSLRWASALVCGSYLIGKLVSEPRIHLWFVCGMVFIVGPAGLALAYRSWRVAVTSMAVAFVLIMVVLVFVALLFGGVTLFMN